MEEIILSGTATTTLRVKNLATTLHTIMVAPDLVPAVNVTNLRRSQRKAAPANILLIKVYCRYNYLLLYRAVL